MLGDSWIGVVFPSRAVMVDMCWRVQPLPGSLPRHRFGREDPCREYSEVSWGFVFPG